MTRPSFIRSNHCVGVDARNRTTSEDSPNVDIERITNSGSSAQPQSYNCVGGNPTIFTDPTEAFGWPDVRSSVGGGLGAGAFGGSGWGKILGVVQ